MGYTLSQLQGMGATAVPPQQSAATAAYQSFVKANVPNSGSPAQSPASPALKDFIKTGAAPGNTAPKQGVIDNLPAGFGDAVKQTGDQYKQAYGNAVNDTADALAGKQSGFSGGFQAGADLLKPTVDQLNSTVGAVVNAPVAALSKLNPVIDFLSGKPQGTTAANQSQGSQQASSAYQAWATAHPEAAKDLEALGTVTQLGGYAAGAEESINAGKEVPGKISNAISDLNTPKASVADLSQTATNSLENKATGIKPGALDNAKAEIQAGTTPPVKVRTLEDGSTFIEDGRHHLEAARQLGITNYPVEDVTSKYTAPAASGDSGKVAAKAIENPLSPTEQEKAASQGRTSIVNGKPTIAPSPRDLAMQEALKPLVENGQVTANVDKSTGLVNGNDQLQNIDNVNKAIKTQGTQISEGVGTHNKPYNPQDLNKAIFKTEVPSSIKPTDEKIQNLQNAIFKIIQDNPKDTQGLLQTRQQFDSLVKKDYPHLYEQGMTPTKQYITGLRETLNDFTAKQLPEGKLPNGVGFRDALQNQHQLINVRDEMTQKFVREYPQGSSNLSRFAKEHPGVRYLGRFFERRALGTVLAGSGATAAITYGLNKLKGK